MAPPAPVKTARVKVRREVRTSLVRIGVRTFGQQEEVRGFRFAVECEQSGKVRRQVRREVRSKSACIQVRTKALTGPRARKETPLPLKETPPCARAAMLGYISDPLIQPVVTESHQQVSTELVSRLVSTETSSNATLLHPNATGPRARQSGCYRSNCFRNRSNTPGWLMSG